MHTNFEAEFGDIKIPKIQIRQFAQISRDENEIFVTFLDLENLLSRTHIPKGECRVVKMVKAPPSCPHCQKELPMMMGLGNYDLKDLETFIYHGATIKGMKKVDEDDYYGDIVELRIHYETLEYKNHITQTIAVLNASQGL